jgi:hypothetical protein
VEDGNDVVQIAVRVAAWMAANFPDVSIATRDGLLTAVDAAGF